MVERAALAGLSLVARVGGTTRSPIDRYHYPPQDSDVQDGEALHLTDGTDFGAVESIDRIARTVDVKKRGAQAEVHPSAVFAHSVVNTDVLAEALLSIGDSVVQHGMSGGNEYRAARELLLSRPPRLRGCSFEPRPDETAVQFAVRIASHLDDTVLAIQGPPGAGKTYTGAQMICDLVRRGARVGVTAVSHKVIRKLLDDTAKAAGEQRRSGQLRTQGHDQERPVARVSKRLTTTAMRSPGSPTAELTSSAPRRGSGRGPTHAPQWTSSS